MSNIKNWSNSSGGNSIASTGGWPENMPASQVNDTARDNMAAIRSWYVNAQWIDLGDTPSYVNVSSFTLQGDKRLAYHVGRRLKFSDNQTMFGTIVSCTYTAAGGGSTGIYVSVDTGNLTSSLSSVAVGIIAAESTSYPIPQTAGHATRASYFAFDDTWSTATAATVAGNRLLRQTIADNKKGDVYLITSHFSASSSTAFSSTIETGGDGMVLVAPGTNHVHNSYTFFDRYVTKTLLESTADGAILIYVQSQVNAGYAVSVDLALNVIRLKH